MNLQIQIWDKEHNILQFFYKIKWKILRFTSLIFNNNMYTLTLLTIPLFISQPHVTTKFLKRAVFKWFLKSSSIPPCFCRILKINTVSTK